MIAKDNINNFIEKIFYIHNIPEDKSDNHIEA
jgi:hypothetical protein